MKIINKNRHAGKISAHMRGRDHTGKGRRMEWTLKWIFNNRGVKVYSGFNLFTTGSSATGGLMAFH
jgi:hypothetical protein